MPKQGRTTRSNRTPYARESASKKEENPGFFGRLKNLFWSREPPAPLGSPVLLTSDKSPQESSEDNTEASESVNGSRITYHSPQRESTPALQTLPPAQFNRSVDSQSFASQTLLESQAGGPNETLRQFFAEKGDAELSNMEVVGVLSLIGQAVGRDESLVDFSTSEATAGTSDLWQGWKQPPTPRAGNSRLGTPRPLLDTTPARPRASRSPWVRPQPQLERSDRPQEGSILQRSERPFVQDSLPRAVLGSSTPSKKGAAASAILKAVNEDTKNTEKEHRPAKTTDFGSVFGVPAPNGAVTANTAPGDTAPGTASGSSAGSGFGSAVGSSASGSIFAGINGSAAPKATTPPVAIPAAASNSSSQGPQNSAVPSTTFNSGADSTTEFEFRIPASSVPRDMTSADEEVVKQAQQEFQF